MNVEIGVTMAIRMEEDGVTKNKFYSLPLEISKISVLSGSWTIVHAIREDSPLYGLSPSDIQMGNTEFLVFLQGFDESFSNTVISRSSYTHRELVYGAKFKPIFHPNEQNTGTIVHVNWLNEYELVPLEGYSNQLPDKN